MSKSNVRSVAADEIVSIGTFADVRAKAACDDAGLHGHWGCVTHDEQFGNNVQAIAHEDDDTIQHVAVWLCDEHGPEVP